MDIEETWQRGGKLNDKLMVEAKNVHKVYEIGSLRVNALQGIDLTIKKGEMISVMGPSGCGKTTLLNCLSGLDDLTEGIVKIEGVSLAQMSDNKRTEYRARRMGFIFQAYNLLPVLTAVENTELPLLLSGCNQKKAKLKALRVLKLVGLEGREYHKPSELSGGEQQRVAIARSLVNDPAIVWADELTGNLDAETSQQIMALLCKLNKENEQTFVVVTHDISIGEMANRVLKLRDGVIEKEYKPFH